jgi:hypothetical protein
MGILYSFVDTFAISTESSLNDEPRHFGGVRLMAVSGRSRLLVFPVGNEVINDSRIGQRGGVAETIDLVGSNLAQDTTHDLA